MVIGLVPSCRGCGWRSESVEGSLFHAKVGVEVGLGGLGGFVAEPEGDGGDVDPGVEHAHRGRMPQCVRGDILAGQARACHGCRLGVNPDSGRDRVGADRCGVALGVEDRTVLVARGVFCGPSAQRDGGGGVQWGDPVFTTLPVNA